MKIFKLLKHDQKTHLYIKNHVDNHGYIISIITITLMALQEKLKNVQIEAYELNFNVPNSYTSNLDIIDILIENTLTFDKKIELMLAYNNQLEVLNINTNIIEVIDVIDSVKPKDIDNTPFTPRSIGQPFKIPGMQDKLDAGGWKTIPGHVGRGGWVTR